MADIDTSWTWNFTGPVTVSKAQSRANLPREVAWDLIGFDGNETGCLRTHPGFTKIGGFTPISGTYFDFKPIAVLTSATTYAYGFVWFEYDNAGDQVKVYAKLNNGTTWLTPNGTSNANGQIATFTSVTSVPEVDVQVMGRFLLVFVRGQAPKIVLFTVASTTWGTTGGTTGSNAGPGAPPVVRSEASTSTAPTGSRINSANADVCVATASSGSGTHIPAGTYSVAVQYLSSTTGRKSAISNTVTITPGSTNNHISYRIFRLTTDYDRALIYRTVSQGESTGASVYGSGTLHLDQVVDISTLTGSASAPSTTQVWNQSKDEQLVYQDVYIDKGKCDTYAPKGGVAEFLGNTLFVSRISDSDSALPSVAGVTPETPPRGIGDMRWSNTGEMQPENFNPSNRWVPKTPANEILNMRQVGLYLMGFSQDRIYRIGRSGQFIRVEEGHIGYGLQARRGLETIGSMAYFVSGGGLKAISAEGQVDDVTALDNLINVTWQANKSELQLAFDAYGQCLTIMKPTTPGEYYADGRAAILWFGTNRITELVDLPFDFVVSGYVVPGPTSTVQRRALFVKWTSAEDVGVYMVDHERSNAPNPHNLCGGVADATAPNLVWSGDVPPSELSQEAYGCAVYNIRTGERLLANELYAELSAFPTGSIGQYFSVAPIVQQWVGGNIGMQIQPGQPEFKDFFRQKQISSCRAYYEVVSALADGQPDPTSALQCDANYPTGTAWRAIVLRGNETQEYATATPTLHPTNEVAPVFCIDNDCWPSKPAGSWPGLIPNASFGKHGTLWSTMSPGWKCWVSGVDLRLLAFSAVGRILDSDRRYT